MAGEEELDWYDEGRSEIGAAFVLRRNQVGLEVHRILSEAERRMAQLRESELLN